MCVCVCVCVTRRRLIPLHSQSYTSSNNSIVEHQKTKSTHFCCALFKEFLHANAWSTRIFFSYSLSSGARDAMCLLNSNAIAVAATVKKKIAQPPKWKETKRHSNKLKPCGWDTVIERSTNWTAHNTHTRTFIESPLFFSVHLLGGVRQLAGCIAICCCCCCCWCI